VPQERLRKLTDDNRELAANLRREAVAQNAPKPVSKSIGKSRRGQGSEIGSGRGSEERTSSIPAGGARGSKRARDNDIEKVGGPSSNSECSHNSRSPSTGGALLTKALDALGKSVSGPYQFPARGLISLELRTRLATKTTPIAPCLPNQVDLPNPG